MGFPGGAVVGSLPADAGSMGSSPGLGGSCVPRSRWARGPRLLSLRVWSLCSATGEAAMVRDPHTTMRSGPRLPQLEKSLTQKQRPNTAINKLKKTKQNKKTKTNKQKKSCTTMFVAALFTIARTWNNLSVHRQMNG